MKIDISKIKENPDNPRVIKDNKFEDLKTSIKNFPKMLEIRPIILNKEYVVLGGNMRLEACRELGLKEVPVLIADKLTAEQEREFVIKDNVSMGDWDWDALADKNSLWDRDELKANGIFLPIQEDTWDYPAETEQEKDSREREEKTGKSDMYVSVICPECAKEFNVKIS